MSLEIFHKLSPAWHGACIISSETSLHSTEKQDANRNGNEFKEQEING